VKTHTARAMITSTARSARSWTRYSRFRGGRQASVDVAAARNGTSPGLVVVRVVVAVLALVGSGLRPPVEVGLRAVGIGMAGRG
jgi:hypothetical protein